MTNRSRRRTRASAANNLRNNPRRPRERAPLHQRRPHRATTPAPTGIIRYIITSRRRHRSIPRRRRESTHLTQQPGHRRQPHPALTGINRLSTTLIIALDPAPAAGGNQPARTPAGNPCHHPCRPRGLTAGFLNRGRPLARARQEPTQRQSTSPSASAGSSPSRAIGRSSVSSPSTGINRTDAGPNHRPHPCPRPSGNPPKRRPPTTGLRIPRPAGFAQPDNRHSRPASLSPQQQESTAGPDTGKIATLNNPDTADALNK